MNSMANQQRYEQRLHAHPEELAAVRSTMQTHLKSWGRGDLAESVALCVTELLANVGKHAGSPECVLALQNHKDSVRGSVTDTEPALPVVREPDFMAESGRGMFLIDRTAHNWGVSPTPTGKEVWFELRVDPTPSKEPITMSVLPERLPTVSHLIQSEPAGPLATRPFGLDSLTNPVPVDGRRPAVAVDPVTQLSLVDGQVCIDSAATAGTSCNTESDGKDAIAIDTDQNDD